MASGSKPIMSRMPLFIRTLVPLLISAALVHHASAFGADAGYRDDRSRIVESSLKDLSNRNDSALGSTRDTPRPAADPYRGDRVDLGPEEVATVEALLRSDIQSGLHRLRRENASRQTPDGRQARVNESLDRQMTEALDRSAGQSAGGGSAPGMREPEFSALVDERLNLRPEDYPATPGAEAVAGQTVESDLHRLHRKADSSSVEEKP
jgi:hypothetical protein